MKKRIIKTVSFLLALVLLSFCLAGCGEKKENGDGKEDGGETMGEYIITNAYYDEDDDYYVMPEEYRPIERTIYVDAWER